jgi:mRNA interferase RelE/StbE
VANYRLLIKASAAKELEALPRRDRQRTISKIHGLASEPRPPGCEKLTSHDLHRIRQGNYRVLYSVDDSHLQVTIIKIGHRRDVYR